MYKKSLLFSVFLFILVVSGSDVMGQVTTAAMNGIIRDKDGNSLPGATVVAVHIPTGTQYGAVTRTDGRFNFPNVKVGGPYTVTATYIGFKEQKREGINLSLGQDYTIDFTLQDSDVQLSEIVISGAKDDILNGDRTGAATNVGNEQIQALPTLTRGINDFSRLTPQFSSNNTFNGFAGRNNLFNNFSLDGAVYNNVYGLTELPAGQTSAQPVSLDAIQELQIQIAPFDVRQGGFTGAGVNAVTRSGTNEFSGSVYSFFKNDKIRKANIVGHTVNGVRVRQNDFSDNQYGFRLGGPIIKNKLFFFVSAELTRANEPAGTFRAARTGDSPGTGDISRVNASTLDSLSDFLRTNYNYNPGAYENYNFKTENDKLFARLDWNINQNHKLTLRHNYVDASRDVGLSNSGAAYVGRSINVDRLPFQNANYIINEKVNSTVLELTSSFGTRFSNDLILTGTVIRNFRETPGGQLFPHVEIGNGIGGGLTSFGYEPFSPNNSLDQDYIQVTDNFNFYAGKHILTVGTSNEFYSFDNSFQANSYGSYSFFDVASFYAAANLAPGTTNVPGNARPTNYVLRYPQIEGTNPTAKFKAYQLSIYAQDEWSVFDRLKLTGGLRIDLPVFPETFRENPAVTEAFGPTYGVSTTKLPKANPLFSPRFGFNWNAKGDRTLQVRGGTGLFSGRPLYAWIGSAVNLNGINFYDVVTSTTGGNTNLNGRPNIAFSTSIPQPTVPPTASRSEINVMDPDFKFPQVWRTNLAIDFKLPLGIVGTLEGLYSKDVNNILFQNLNLITPTNTVPGDGREAFPTGNKEGTTVPNRIVDNRFTDVVILTNTKKGYQYNITAQLQKSFTQGFFASVAYNYGRAKDLTSGSSSQPTSAFNNNEIVTNPNTPVLATSNFEQRHRLIANISYKREYAGFLATTLSFFYQAYSGSPYSYIYSGDINNDGNSRDLMYIPKDRNDIELVRVTGSGATRTVTAAPEEDYDKFEAFINQDPYLKENRGKYAERNGATTPWVFKLDARLLQDFYVNVKGKQNTLQLSIDLINLGNLLNSKFGVVKNFTRNNPLNYVDAVGADGEAGTEDDHARFSYTQTDKSFIDSTGLTSRWQMQVGVRYIFN